MTTNIEQTKQALKALFQLPAQERVGSEREAVMVYLMAVEGIPSGFVATACKRFIQGQVVKANLTWRPTPAELAVEARRLQEKAMDRERLAALPSRSVRALPKPDPADPTPEERQRCAEAWNRARREIEAAADAARMPRKGRTAVPKPDYTPKVDISDLPAADASSAEVKAWEERQENREGQHADDG